MSFVLACLLKIPTNVKSISIFTFVFCSWIESQWRGFESRLQQTQTSDSI